MANGGFSLLRPSGCTLVCQWCSLTVLRICLQGLVLLVSPGTNIKNFGAQIHQFIRQGQLQERTTEKPRRSIVTSRMLKLSFTLEQTSHSNPLSKNCANYVDKSFLPH